MKIQILIILLFPILSMAQNATSIKEKKSNNNLKSITTPKKEIPFKSNINIQALIGSQGLGVDLKIGFRPKTSLRLGTSLMAFKRKNLFEIDGFDTENNLDANFSNIHLLLNYLPFKTEKFHVVFGAGYLFQPNANVLLMPNSSNPYIVGNYQLKANEIGELNMGIKWNSLAPYIGFGFLQAFPKKKFNVNLDLGTYFLGSPNSTVTGTKMLQNNATMEPILNENLSGYKFLPVLQMNFNYKIK